MKDKTLLAYLFTTLTKSARKSARGRVQETFKGLGIFRSASRQALVI